MPRWKIIILQCFSIASRHAIKAYTYISLRHDQIKSSHFSYRNWNFFLNVLNMKNTCLKLNAVIRLTYNFYFSFFTFGQFTSQRLPKKKSSFKLILIEKERFLVFFSGRVKSLTSFEIFFVRTHVKVKWSIKSGSVCASISFNDHLSTDIEVTKKY